MARSGPPAWSAARGPALPPAARRCACPVEGAFPHPRRRGRLAARTFPFAYFLVPGRSARRQRESSARRLLGVLPGKLRAPLMVSLHPFLGSGREGVEGNRGPVTDSGDPGLLLGCTWAPSSCPGGDGGECIRPPGCRCFSAPPGAGMWTLAKPAQVGPREKQELHGKGARGSCGARGPDPVSAVPMGCGWAERPSSLAGPWGSPWRASAWAPGCWPPPPSGGPGPALPLP